MVKIDLVTGFLGSGKTTFIKKYAQYFLSQGIKVGILENDYGAINVDMMLLSDLQDENLGLEMVAGGCDYDCHKRRFKTKLITMAMLGYQRVIVEPSGIFDVDEFFDVLHEDRLADMYEIDNVLTVVEANLSNDLSKEADILLASQIACAGRIILSHMDESDDQQVTDTLQHIHSALKSISCHREFFVEKNITAKNFDLMNEDDFNQIIHSGYREASYVKHFSMDENGFESLFFMNFSEDKDTLVRKLRELWNDDVGNILRIKGFVQDKENWVEINSTKNTTHVREINQGQKIIIVIGEKLNREKISSYFDAQYSSNSVIENAAKLAG